MHWNVPSMGFYCRRCRRCCQLCASSGAGVVSGSEDDAGEDGGEEGDGGEGDGREDGGEDDGRKGGGRRSGEESRTRLEVGVVVSRGCRLGGDSSGSMDGGGVDRMRAALEGGLCPFTIPQQFGFASSLPGPFGRWLGERWWLG